jgi:hypothetical protein
MSEPIEVRNEEVESSVPTPSPTVVQGQAIANSPQRKAVKRSTALPYGYRGRQAVWLAVAVVDAFLALRFVLLAAEAGASGFTSFIYTVGVALSHPFQTVFGTTTSSGHPLQWAALLAIAVYTFAAWVASRLILIAATPSSRGLTAH